MSMVFIQTKKNPPGGNFSLKIYTLSDIHRDMKQNRSNLKRAEDYGIDLTLIDSNLLKTPSDRIRTMQEFANLINILQKAGQRYYAKHRKDN